MAHGVLVDATHRRVRLDRRRRDQFAAPAAREMKERKAPHSTAFSGPSVEWVEREVGLARIAVVHQ